MNEKFQIAIDALESKVNSEKTVLSEFFSKTQNNMNTISGSILKTSGILEEICDNDLNFFEENNPKLSREKFMFVDNDNSQRVYEVQTRALDYALVSKLKANETKSKFKSILEYDYDDAHAMSLCNIRLLSKANNREICEKLAEIKVGFSAEKWSNIVGNGKMITGISYNNAVKCLEILKKYNVKAVLLNSYAYNSGNKKVEEIKQPCLDVISKVHSDEKDRINTLKESGKNIKDKYSTKLFFGILILSITLIWLIVGMIKAIGTVPLIFAAIVSIPGIFMTVKYGIIMQVKNKKFFDFCNQEENNLKSDYEVCVAKFQELFNKVRYGIPKDLAYTYTKDIQEGYSNIMSVRAEYLPKVRSKIDRNEKYLARALAFLPENIANNDRLLMKVVELMKGGFATDYKTALWQAKQEIEKEDEKTAALRREEERDREEREHRQAVLESQKRAEKMAQEQAKYAQEQARYAREQANAAAAMAESQRRAEDYAKHQAEAAEKTARETEAIHNNQKFGTDIY